MKAVLIDNAKHLVWSDVPDPVRKPGEIIIDIKAAGINRADLMQREGNYPPPPGWPEWPGLECAGIVAEADPDCRFKPGDKVCALLGGGGYAEKVAVPCGMVLPVPEGLSFAEAASLPETFATSFLNLRLEAGMKEGDKVFIQAGASGLGISAIQIAKAYGAKVITTVGSDSKAEFVRSLGADVVVNHAKAKVSDAFKEFPPDIAMDCVCGPELGACLENMARGGRWVVIATLGGGKCEIDMGKFFRLGIRLIGSTLRSRTSEAKTAILAALEKEFWPKFTAGAVRPVIHATFPMEEAEAAQGVLQRRENIGKVVLVNRGV